MPESYSDPLRREVIRATSEVLGRFIGIVIDDKTIPQILSQISDEVNTSVSGLLEASHLLGVTRQRVHQYIHYGQMPEIAARVYATPLWLTKDLVELAKVKDEHGSLPKRT